MRLECTSTHAAFGATLTIALAAGGARAQDLPMYHVTFLGDMVEEVFPGVEYPTSNPTDLNENGDLVGVATLDSDPEGGAVLHAFVYTIEHGVTALPLVPGFPSNATTGLNDRDGSGEIVIVGGGVYGQGTPAQVAALWRFSTVTGEVLETRTIPIPPGSSSSVAVAVNNDGTVVGSSGSNPVVNWKYDVATGVLETFDFPVQAVDLNDAGQVCGGSYRGDLFGNWEDLTDPYDPGDDMPDWAIDLGGISPHWSRINNQGWLVGWANTWIPSGGGHTLTAVLSFTDPTGWTVIPPCCWNDSPRGINDHGDFLNGWGDVHFVDMGLHRIDTMLAPAFATFFNVSDTRDINGNRQIAGFHGHAILLTPLGVMVIPGDVNGDVRVDLDDHCAWLANPIDLDGDGDADDADEQWLIARLAVFGLAVEDCNGNGVDDHCDILDGLSADCDTNDVPDECQPDCSGDGVPDACEDDCNGNGIADPCDIAGLTSLDCNENGIPDECDGGGTTEVMRVFDPPIDLVPGVPLSDEVLVVDAGTIDDVDFTIDIDYRIGFLTVLLSHGGTTITLVDRPGHPDVFLGNGQLGYDIVLDDEGTGGAIEDQGNFSPPFEPITSPPSYTPNEPLSTFDGMPSDGVWTVQIVTTSDAHPVHALHDWGLTITRASVDVGSCDCNGNGVPDDQDIAGGTSADGNGNGVPDECEGPAGDATGDGRVDVDDLVMVILGWGPCPDPPDACAADVDGSGVVDVDDLVMVILNWS